jgi:hypothetical protein
MAIPGRMAKANKDRSMVGFAARDTTNGANQWTLNLFNARSNTIVGVNYNGTEEVRGVRWLTTEEAKLPEKIKKYVESVLVLVGKDARILERILVLKAAPIEPTKDKMVK